MIETTYRGLPEFGLPLITPDHPTFKEKAEEILRLAPPFGPRIESIPERAAILENQSGKAVITFTTIWRYIDEEGETRTTRQRNLVSSKQMDVLTGRTMAIPDPYSFFLPGSRRLITDDRILGDNRDVLGVQPAGRAGGGGGWGFAGGRIQPRDIAPVRPEPVIVKIELDIDIAIFDDGTCAGADECGLRESLIEQMQRQKDTAREIVAELRAGATPGQVFEIIRPLARHVPQGPRAIGCAPLLSMFANSAVRQLINAPDHALLAWFERAAKIEPLHLRRPA